MSTLKRRWDTTGPPGALAQVPTVAVVIFGSLTSLIALLFDIATLVEFLSIGTLMAYTIVSAAVIIVR
jgi:amino acid transporter